jgi:lipopolysaccharide/colanic/teichoic acid biosynthesis glycosyltransferase
MTPTTGSPRAQTERRVTRRVETGRASQTEIAHPLVVVRNADYAPWTAPTPPTAPDVAADEEPVNLINRAFNVAIASLAMVVLSPVLLLVALAVKLTSPGPIVYTQTRVGLNRRGYGRTLAYDRRVRDLGGRPFVIYKFRSMRSDAEAGSGAIWAARGDARVTPLGRVMRKLRLDELPQLINVIKGDMNIVGPRPERPSIFASLTEQVDQYAERQRARPGITGWAQINLAYDSCLDDVKQKVQYDLEYIERQSLLEDCKIMLRTVPVILLRRGGW